MRNGVLIVPNYSIANRYLRWIWLIVRAPLYRRPLKYRYRSGAWFCWSLLPSSPSSAAGLSVRIWVTGGGISYIWSKNGIRIPAPTAIVTITIASPFPNLLGDVRIIGSLSSLCESCELVSLSLPIFSGVAHAVYSHNTSL